MRPPCSISHVAESTRSIHAKTRWAVWFTSGRAWKEGCTAIWKPEDICFQCNKPECERKGEMLFNCSARETLGVPWTARRSNQSILKEINLEYSLERLMLKLTLQYFGNMIRRADSLEKTLMLGKMEGRRRRGWPSPFEDEMARWHHQLNGNEFEQPLEIVEDKGTWHTAGHGAARSQAQL